MAPHSNALVAIFFFISVIVSDALTALDSVNHNTDVPASLRGTNLVLVCCFAAPVLVRPGRGIYGWLQRPLIGAALFAAALTGMHYGGSTTRTFDAIYSTSVCFAITWLYSAGRIDEVTRNNEKGDKIDKAVSISSAMLATALLLYGNIRLMRTGLRHSIEVRNFHVQPSRSHNASSALQTLGYAYASDVATVSVSFGGAVGIGAAIVMVYHARELAFGTPTVALQLGVAAVFQLVAALAATLSYGDQANWLSPLFGHSACVGSSGACDVAATSRRFASANTQSSGLWLSALGLFALAYPTSNRFKTRDEVSNFSWSATGSTFGIVAAISSLALVYLYVDFSGHGGHTDYVLMASLFAVYCSVFVDTFVGTVMYLVAFVIEEVFYVRNYGVAVLFSHATHTTLVFSAALLILHLVLQSIAFCWAPRELQLLIGVVTAAGSSLAVALYCASACLLMVNNGSLGELQDTDDGTRFAVSFIFQHFVPVLIWAPLYTCRCEIQLLNRAQRLIAWVLVVPLDVILYAICLTVLDVNAPTAALVDAGAIAGCVVGAGLVPWLVASSV